VNSIAEALAEAQALAAQREWQVPSEATVAEAQCLLDLVSLKWPAPEVQTQADGSITLDWEADLANDAHGWLTLTVIGKQTVEHAAVIDGDEYGLSEAFIDVLPDWAQELLRRLHDGSAYAPKPTVQ
jgi:hypothetical protein